MEVAIYYWDKLAFEAVPTPTDPKTGTVLNRIVVTDSEGPSLNLWLDEPSARALQRALAELYPAPSPEDAALDAWASDHEAEFLAKLNGSPAASEVWVAPWVRGGE